MKTVFSEKHELRAARTEPHGGELVPPFERPERARLIKARVEEVGLGPVIAEMAHGLAPVLAVHDPLYLGFLATAFQRWQAAGYQGEALPTSCWPASRPPSP